MNFAIVPNVPFAIIIIGHNDTIIYFGGLAGCILNYQVDALDDLVNGLVS